MNKKYDFYADGGSLGNHGLKYGDQIIKTMSGGVQKVKTKTGDIVYVNLANGYRGAEPPLPFATGGGVDGKKYLTIYKDEWGSEKSEFDNYSDALADYNDFASDDANISLYEIINGEKKLLKKNVSSANIQYVELSNGDIVVSLEKIDGKWEEKEVLEGETPYGWGSKRYMSYLKPKDLAQFLSKDYGGYFEIVEQYAKGGGVRKVGNREYSTGRNWTNDHLHVNKSEQHEVNYNRRNSLFFAGGGEIRRFDRQAQMDSETREEILDVLSESDTPKVLTNYLYGLFDGYDYSETANFKKEVEFLKRKNPKLHQRVVDIYKKIDKYKFEKYQDNYANGGVTKNYVQRKELNTITIKKGDQKLTYKVSDVYNGAYKLEDGGNLQKTAFYVPKRNVVKVQLRDGKDVKVANGYWIKKGAKPIHTSKYDDGGKVLYKDLFEDYENQPEELKEIVNFYEIKWEKADYDYKDSFNFQKEVETIGYTFNYGLDNEPFALRKKDVKLNQVIGYKDMDAKNDMIFANGGVIGKEMTFYRHGEEEKGIIGEVNEDGSYNVSTKYSIILVEPQDVISIKDSTKKKGFFFEGGGKTTFNDKATAIAKNFEGKKVEPKYQKEYGKTYDKAEAKEVGNKIAGSQKAKYDSKMSSGGKTKRGGSMQLAKQIRKEGESWGSAIKRANEQIRNK